MFLWHHACIFAGCLEMTELAVVRSGKCPRKWIMCPTCRQRTDIENIAYVAEKQNTGDALRMSDSCQIEDMPESSILVQGSYGTKVFFYCQLYCFFSIKVIEEKLI